MISRLPRWIGFGGALLGFVAGWVNAAALLDIRHQAVSYVTGSVAEVGVAVARGDLALALHLGGIVLAFLLGAIVSGLVVRDASIGRGRNYGAALGIESGLIILAIPLLTRELAIGQYLLSAACGLQNALASTFSGAVVRTTHLTGIATDLGILIGHRLRGLKVDGRHTRLFGAIVTGFLLGAIGGAATFTTFGAMALLVPAALTLGAAIASTRLRAPASGTGPLRVTLHHATADDLPALADLYARAVDQLADAHYDAAAREAWAAFAKQEAFAAFVLEADTLVARSDGITVGFSGLTPKGHIASLYVAPEAAGRGVARTLVEAQLVRARQHGHAVLTTDASAVSRPIFERLGFDVVAEERVNRNGAIFLRYQMQRHLPPEPIPS
jgi:uncharacterized membrane protein YoaK (UPF0700 family)/ribosomal protein S18 acetylase RimI-like enzyme